MIIGEFDLKNHAFTCNSRDRTQHIDNWVQVCYMMFNWLHYECFYMIWLYILYMLWRSQNVGLYEFDYRMFARVIALVSDMHMYMGYDAEIFLNIVNWKIIKNGKRRNSIVIKHIEGHQSPIEYSFCMKRVKLEKKPLTVEASG